MKKSYVSSYKFNSSFDEYSLVTNTENQKSRDCPNYIHKLVLHISRFSPREGVGLDVSKENFWVLVTVNTCIYHVYIY